MLARDEEAAVRLGVFQSVGAQLLPPALAQAVRARPDLRVHLVAARRPSEAFALLRNGTVDLAFTEEPAADDSLSSLVLLHDPYVILARAGDARALGSIVSIDQLARLPLLTYETCTHLLRVEQALARLRTVLNPVVRSDDAPTLHGLVASGVGYALLPRLAINTGDSRVIAVPVDPRIPHRTVCLAWHRERGVTASMRVILAASKQVAHELQRARIASRDVDR